jgi:hypothetical protein
MKKVLLTFVAVAVLSLGAVGFVPSADAHSYSCTKQAKSVLFTYKVAHVLEQKGWIDKATDFEPYKNALKNYFKCKAYSKYHSHK